jgi:hypothetical protein
MSLIIIIVLTIVKFILIIRCHQIYYEKHVEEMILQHKKSKVLRIYETVCFFDDIDKMNDVLGVKDVIEP